MSQPMDREEKIPIKFTISELAGAFGDFGTIIPLMFAAALVCNLNLGMILLFFGIWFIITGFYYRLPVPIEPMKVIAVVAISSVLAGPELAAAGIMLGLLFFFLGFGRWMEWINRYVPDPVIRGIQLGLALLLLKSAGEFMLRDPLFFAAGVAIIIAFFLISWFGKIPDISALIVILTAVVIGIVINGVPGIYMIQLPQGFAFPSAVDFFRALPELVVPQAIITVTNAILATSLLATDLFRKDIPPRNLSRTIGVMNLVSAPFGGFPMCHGAGGFAAQYRFGARTGGANIFAGIVFIAIALFFAGPAFQQLISPGFYGALLLFVALEMGKYGLKTDSALVTIVTGVLALFSMIAAFIAGMAIAYLLIVHARKKGPVLGTDANHTALFEEK